MESNTQGKHGRREIVKTQLESFVSVEKRCATVVRRGYRGLDYDL